MGPKAMEEQGQGTEDGPAGGGTGSGAGRGEKGGLPAPDPLTVAYLVCRAHTLGAQAYKDFLHFQLLCGERRHGDGPGPSAL